jgi:hypothetical protein
VTAQGGSVTLTAGDNSDIRSDAGGFAAAIGGGLPGSAAVSIGASVGDNEIGQNSGQFVKAYIDSSTVTASGNVTLTTFSTAEIDARSMGGSLAGAGGALAGALAGAGAGSINNVKEVLISAIQTGSAVTTTPGSAGNVALSSTDGAVITADAGGVALAIAGGGVGVSGSVGAAIGKNTITDSATADITGSSVLADGSVNLQAASNASITDLTFGGSGSGAEGDAAAVALAGAGAGATNTVTDTADAYIKDCQNTAQTLSVVATHGNVTLAATDGSSITAKAGGGSVSFAVSPDSGAGALAITAVTATNSITDHIDSYIDNSFVQALSSGGEVTLQATTLPTSQISSFAVAASIAGAIAPASAGLAGGGAGATNTITNTIQAYINDSANVQADQLISVTATDNAGVASTVGSGALGFGFVGASIGVSVQTNNVTNTVSAYINAPVTVNNGGIQVTSGSTVTATGLAVATSVAVGSRAFAGSGDQTNTTIGGTVQAYVGASGTLTVPSTSDVLIQATSNQNAQAGAKGGAVSVGVISAAIGVSLGTATINGTTQAYMSGKLPAAHNLTVEADNSSTGGTDIFALAGGIGLGGAGAGAQGTVNINPTVNAYVDGAVGTSTSPLSGDVTVRSIVDTSSNASAEGVSFSTGASVAGSVARDNISPNVTTYIGKGAQITAGGAINVETYQNEDVNGNPTGSGATATAEASAGSLLGTGTGAQATADNSPNVSAYVDQGTILRAGAQSPITVEALANNVANAQTRGIAVAGLLAVGATISDATTKGSLKAYVDGAIGSSGAVTVQAQGADTANASSTAVAGGILSGSGAVANATVAPTVQAYTDGSQLTSTGAVVVAASETPQSLANVSGVAAGGLAVGVSSSDAEASPTVTALTGGAGDTITAGSLSVDATTSTPTGGHSANSQATGSAGVLIGVAATSSTANDSGTVTSSIASQTNLAVANAVTVQATGDTNQYAMGTSNFLGIIAAGSNTANADSSAQTTATVGSGASIGAGTAIGGLTDGTIYYVVPDPNNPGLIRLADSFQDATKATTGTPPGDPGSAAVTLPLSQPTIQAGNHSLTPYNISGAAPITFNPATALSNSKINVGPDSGLFVGEAVVYHESNGPSLTITANGDDVNFADAVAGSRGLVAGAAASANTNSGGGASASIADYSGSGNKTQLNVSSLTIDATHTAEFDSQTNTLQADSLGFSGSWANNTDSSTADAHIGSNAQVTTQDLQVLATNNTKKDLVPAGQNNVSAGSGGVLQGNAAQSTTSITNNTTADVGAGANLNVTGSITDPGLFALYALNNVDGTDTVNLDTGGLIDGSDATSTIHADTNNATAEIGSNAVVTTVGDVNLDTRTTANVSVAPTVHTYGLASPGSIDGEATLGEADRVKVDGGATITAQGNLNLNAGGDMNGDLNDLTMGSNAYELNASTVPAFELTSKSEIDQTNTIDVAAGSLLKGARNANLTAQRFGNAITNAFGTGKDWLTAVAGGLSSLFGGDGISSDTRTGTGIVNTTTSVTVDGTIQLGINNQQSLTIQKDILANPGDFSQTGGITFAQTVESLAADLGQELLRLENLQTAYVGDTNAENAYSADIQQIEAQMEQLGLGETQTDASGNNVFVPITSSAVPFITVSPILAEAGTLTVTGDDLLGGGQLLAPGDVRITITNNSPAFLRLNQITIPQSFGGTVFFDGTSVTSASAIGQINKSKAVPSFSQVQADNTLNPPSVTITNTYDASDPANNNFEGENFISPDINLDGDISAPPTVLVVSSKGSVITEANINVGKATITAGANFIQSYTPGIDSIGGNPATLYSGVTSLTEANAAASNPSSPLGDNLSVTAANGGTAVQQAVYDAIHSTSEGNILAGNDVFISAQYLNIDGTIQSGEPYQSVTIDSTSGPLYNPNIPGWTATESMTDAITVASDAYYLNRIGFQSSAQDLLSASGVWTQDYKEFLLPEHIGDNIKVYYDAPQNQLVLGQVQVQGGLAVLYGQILNTGTGNINVLDGLGQIKVVNNTAYTLVTSAMSTGQGTAGLLKITDTGKEDASGHPLVTEYYRQNGQVYTNSYYAEPDGTVASVVSSPAQYTGPNAGPRSASYQPAAARLVWEDGQDLSVTVTDLYRTSSWIGLIHLGSSNLVSSTTQAGTPEPLLDGEYIQSLPGVTPGQGSDSADYGYSFQQINSGTATTQVSSWKHSTWYGKTTYYEKTVTTTPKKNINTNSIRADRPINITFTGFDAGDPNQLVSVGTQGDLDVDGSILNDGGTTTLSAPSGAIVEENDSSAVGGKNITLTAANGIGAGDPLRLAMTGGATPASPNPGTLNATSTSGDINLDDVTGSMTIGRITTAQGTGDVTLTADESLFAADTNSLVTGDAVTLNAKFGSVGTLGTNGTANSPAANALPITVDIGSATLDKLTVTAQGDVYVRQSSAGGDLRLNKINSAAGNVRVVVPNGNLVDANNVSVPDTQNLTELEALWNRMLATQSTAQVSINNTIDAYESQIDQEYQSYWQFRNEQPNPSVYDPNFQVTLPAAQLAAWTQFYTAQGTSQGLTGTALTTFVQNAITTLENQQTQEYHTLNTTFGKFGNTYNPSFRYYANQTPLNVGPNLTFGSSNVSGNDITLTGNAYTTGQAVVYHANGGSVAGLTDSHTYYVIVNSNNPDQISLAATYADATALTPVPIKLGTVTGTGNTLSEIFQTFGPSSVDSTGYYIHLPQNVFNTGQAVVYHANGGSVGGLTDGNTYYVVLNPNDPTYIGLDASSTDATSASPTLIALGTINGAGNYLSEVDVESQRAAWSQSQLQNSINLSVVDPRDFPSTVQSIPDANIEGKNVALVVSGSIGAVSGQDVINLPLTAALPQNTALDLAAAQPADITFYNADGTVAHPTDPTFNPVKLTVSLEKGFSLENTGVVDASAGGNIELVSGKDLANNGPLLPITIDQVTAAGGVSSGHAAGVVRILGLNGVVNGRTDANAAIIGGNLFLEGGNTGGIGSSSVPLVIDLAPTALLEEANAENDVYLIEKGGALDLVSAFSATGTVSLTADGSILNGNTLNDLNIEAENIKLLAGNDGDSTATLGTRTNPANPLYIELTPTGGSVVAQAPSDVNLDEVSGDLIVSNIFSRNATVNLSAPFGSILEPTSEPVGTPVVSGNNIVLSADPLLGFIGAATNPLEIDAVAPGTLTSSSGQNAYITQPVGDLDLNTVTVSNGGTAFISAVAGNIFNGNPSGENVLAGKTFLFANLNIGTSTSPIATKVGNIQGQSTTGSTWLDNTGALVVGGIDATKPGVQSGGTTNILAHSPVTVDQNINSQSDVNITSSHDADGGNMEVATGVSIIAATGVVNFFAGENFTEDAGSLVMAAQGSINIYGDYNNTSGPGSVITINGALSAPAIVIDANGAQAIVYLNNPSGINNAPGQTTGLLTVNGGPGTNQLIVNDSADSKSQTGILTSSTINGLGIGGSGIVYETIQHLAVDLGTGGDTFSVQSTNSGTTTVITAALANSAANTFIVGNPTPKGKVVSGIAGPLIVQGTGIDTMSVDDTGDSVSRIDGVLTTTTLKGLGMATSGISYSGLSTLNISLGSGGTMGNMFAINVAAGENLPATTSITGGSSGKDQLNANWAVDPNGILKGDFNGTLNLFDFLTSAIMVGNDFNGSMTDANPGTITSISIGGSLTSTGILTVSSASDPSSPMTSMGLFGDIGTMTVGGSIAGRVQVSGNINTLDVGPANTPTANDVNDVSGTGKVIVGGALMTASISGNVSGLIQETLTIDSLYIGGSLTQPGTISAVNMVNPALGNINLLTIVQDLAGTLIASGTLGTFNLGGSLTSTGSLEVGSIGTMTVDKDVAGRIQSTGPISSLTIGSTAYAGSVTATGQVSAGQDITTMQVYGDVAGKVQAGGNIGSMTVGSPTYHGSVSGLVSAGNNITTMQVYGDVSGTIQAGATIGSLTIGSTAYLGSVKSTGLVSAGQDITTMQVYGDVAGKVQAGGNIGSLTVGSPTYHGSVSGLVSAAKNITTMQVDGDVSGTVQAGATITSLTIGSTAYAGSVTPTGLVSAGQDITTMRVYGNVAGIVSAGGTINNLRIDGSVIPTTSTTPPPNNITEGIITATTINTLTVIGSMAGKVNASGNLKTMSVGQDMSGLINVGNTLTQLTVTGGTPGSIVAKAINTVGTSGGYGAVVAQIQENGIQRRIEAAVPSVPYTLPVPVQPTAGYQLPLYTYPTSATAAYVSPAKVNFQYFYEGLASNNGILTNPQLTVRVTNNSGITTPDQYDLSLVTWSDTAKFNLARLDAAANVNNGISGIRNVAVEGDLLPAVTSGAQSFFGLTSTQGGVRLPQDQLAGVEVRDNSQAGLVQAMSIQGLAFGSLTVSSSTGTTTQTGAASNQSYASQLLTSGTAIVQAGAVNSSHQETFRVPFDNGSTVAVAFFLDDNKNAVLDNSPVDFTDQDQFVTTGDPRGTVTALVAINGPALTGSNSSIIQTMALAGDGGSFATKLPIAAQVTSTGPLGDLNFQATQGITANVTAPSIFGNIAASGPIAGIIQTDGRWTNMTTGLTSMISADLGRTNTDTNGNVLSVTTISAQGGGLTGQIVSRGNLNSQITASGGISGVIAAQGDLGLIQYNSISKRLVRFGGIQSNGTISGQVLTLGNIFGDINMSGNLTGRIAANGRPLSLSLYPSNLGLPSTATGILGNITIGGSIGTSTVQGVIVSRAEIGDSTLGTALSLSKTGAVNGILAAEGPISFVKPVSSSSTFFIFDSNGGINASPGTLNAAAIDAIFEDQNGLPITTFDVTPLDLANLNQILNNLARLHVVKNSSGQYALSDSK